MSEVYQFKGRKVYDRMAINCRECRCNCAREEDFMVCNECIFESGNELILAEYLLTHHCKLTENIMQFGMLSKEKQYEFKAVEKIVNAKSNIQIECAPRIFRNLCGRSSWSNNSVFRLDPDWKPEPPAPVKKTRQMTAEELYRWSGTNGYEVKAYRNGDYREGIISAFNGLRGASEQNALLDIGAFRFSANEITHYRKAYSQDEWKKIEEVEDK